ncbi:hypothetical protein [Baia soyae]|uniref:Uncharacterized protein n=1 Tax=Baia soyae TaxID=1544746 RepID=A0A4R2S492_9BACL|nr:hypothetical protein [Baia soyae]TCP70592.1 hypothetical protein EDD57_10132 [Baia soyae]
MNSIQILMEKGFILKVIGDLREPLNPALVVWARHQPKQLFRCHVALSRAITSNPLQVYVDDVCAALVTRRSIYDQAQINKHYQEFFSSLGCHVVFSSDLFNERYDNQLFSALMLLGRTVPFNEFSHCLPEKKRRQLHDLHFGEVMHALCELLLFEHVKEQANVLLIGQFSQAIIAMHRNISKKPLSGIVFQKFIQEQCIEDYLEGLEEAMKTHTP